MAVERTDRKGSSQVSTLSVELADRIIRRIIDGTYEVGSRLPTEREMAQEYGVNRLVVREALKRVEAFGLVTIRHGSGTYVEDIERKGGVEITDLLLFDGKGSFDNDFLRDVINFNVVVAINVIWLAARNIDEEELGELKRLVEMRGEKRDDGQELAAINIEIMRTIVKATHNRYIQLVFNTLMRITRGFEMVLEAPAFIYEEYQAYLVSLVEAFEERDSEIATLLTTRAIRKVIPIGEGLAFLVGTLNLAVPEME